MSLRGLPDFYQPIQGESWQVFYPYEGGAFVAVPTTIELGDREDGQTDFTLTLVRGQNPDLPPKPYGLLDFRLQPRYPIAEALTELRSRRPDAMVQPAMFTSGFLRLYPATTVEPIPEDLKQPIPLAWNGLSTGRYSLRASAATITLLKTALTGTVLNLLAQAEMELVGVAPRLPLRVKFNPAILLDRLAALGDSQRRVASEDIVDYLRNSASQPLALPLEIIGDITDIIPNEFAVTFTDWIRAHYGTFIPSPRLDRTGYIALARVEPDRIKPEIVEWDLSKPIQTTRTIELSLHPLEAARQIVAERGLDAVFQEVIVPQLPTGALSVEVSANLPAKRLGVLAIGVTLRAVPFLPYRPQAQVVSTEFQPPHDCARLFLRLSPIEKPVYTFATYVVLQDAQGVRQLRSAEIFHQGNQLALQPNQFPVSFIPISATRSLLEQGTVEGICRWQEGQTIQSQTFELNQQSPVIALTLPQAASHPTLEFNAYSLDRTRSLVIPPMPARSYQLGLHSFVEYGSHLISIECEFNDQASFYAIELLPENAPETEARLILLTPDHPRQTWSWLATSPFYAGYRYRPHRSPDRPVADWSDVQSPFTPLKLQSPSGGS
ncbi:MAG: hypothetical protein HC827_07220 [Cyanobacteria bacterium RM1_2_2]|nr:hypothetical protein [Cyanobacteria bacterium RM1_2_2]